MSPQPAFVDTMTVIEMLGVSSSQFYRCRPQMRAAGFPEPDPIMNKYLRADVEAWVNSRRKIKEDDTVEGVETKLKVNTDAL